MKENRNYGFKLRLYFGIILLIAAAIVGHTNFKQPDAQALYNEGNVYQRTSDLDNKTVSLKVTQIGDQPAIPSKNGKNAVYIVQFEYPKPTADSKYGYIGLELNEETAKKLIQKNNTLSEHPEYVAGTFISALKNSDAIKDFNNLMTEAYNNRKLLSVDAEEIFYISTTSLSGAQKVGLFVMCGLIAFGVLFIGLAFWKRKKINASYDELYQAYPELRGNLDLITKNASYVDDELHIYIYKKHFITTFGGLNIYDLSKANRVYHYQVNHKKYGTTTYTESFLVFISNDANYRGHKTKLAILNIGESTDDCLQPFFRAALQEFPTLKVGYESDRPF